MQILPLRYSAPIRARRSGEAPQVWPQSRFQPEALTARRRATAVAVVLLPARPSQRGFRVFRRSRLIARQRGVRLAPRHRRRSSVNEGKCGTPRSADCVASPDMRRSGGGCCSGKPDHRLIRALAPRNPAAGTAGAGTESPEFREMHQGCLTAADELQARAVSAQGFNGIQQVSNSVIGMTRRIPGKTDS